MPQLVVLGDWHEACTRQSNKLRQTQNRPTILTKLDDKDCTLQCRWKTGQRQSPRHKLETRLVLGHSWVGLHFIFTELAGASPRSWNVYLGARRMFTHATVMWFYIWGLLLATLILKIFISDGHLDDNFWEKNLCHSRDSNHRSPVFRTGALTT